MSPEKLRVGIVGASINASWGPQTHVPAVKALPEFVLEAVCTAHSESAKASAEQFGARLAFHDHREMVNHPDVDVVTVSVRVPNHHQVTMDALAAGKHVYTEWPLALNVQEAQEMADLARAKEVHTMVGLQSRASPVNLRIKELVEEGYVGKVQACHLTQLAGSPLQRTSARTWQRHRSMGANPLTISFGHTIDIFCHCFGDFSELSAALSTEEPQWYETDTQRYVDVTAPDNILVSGRLQGGAWASVHVTSVRLHSRGFRLEVYGQEGTLVATSRESPNTGWPKLMGGNTEARELAELPIPGRLTWVPENIPQGYPFNVAQMYRRFAEAIHSGQRVEPDFDTALERHRLLTAIERSAEEGKRQVLV